MSTNATLPAALVTKLAHLLDSMSQDDATGEILLLRRVNGTSHTVSMIAHETNLDELVAAACDGTTHLVILDGGNSHGDAWKFIFHPHTHDEMEIDERLPSAA